MSKIIPITSLYREYLRAIRQLPQPYLRQFYRLKVRDDFDNLRETRSLEMQQKKYKRISKELRRMNDGLRGDWRNFDHILDIAYGRRGKLRHELLEPFLSDPNAQVPPPIIPAMPRSRPPVYSPELRSLLTNEMSRMTKPLRPSYIDRPPTLPPQANPNSEEAKLWGRLSKRREKNILQRYYKDEIQKVYPPLEVRVKGDRTLEEVGARPGAAQKLHLMDEINSIVGPLWKPPPLTRKERKSQGEISSPEPGTLGHPSRWLRRRYQSLLQRLPILTFTPGQKPGTGRYNVEGSLKALGNLHATGGRLLPVASEAQLAWHPQTPSDSKPRKL